MSDNRAELVFIPGTGVGHLITTVQLAKLILESNHTISISILLITLPNQSSKLKAYIESESCDNPYSTRLVFVYLPSLTNLPDPSSSDFFTAVIEHCRPLVKDLFNDRLRVGLPKPVGLVLDMFCSAFVDVGDELGVPSYIYCTSGASLLNFVFWAQTWADSHGLQACDFAAKMSDPNDSFMVPGFKNPVTSKNIPAFLKKEWGSEIIFTLAQQLKRMKGILVNSYMELEPLAIQSLKNSEDKSIPPVYPVGPILNLKSGDGSHDKEKDNDKKSTLEWLDSQPVSSVVFLCFGSTRGFDEEQVKEIANGLDRSGHRFLWALRRSPTLAKPEIPNDNETFSEALPEGFLDRTLQRGKIIGWAPQVEVLAHPGIGGFVSHCGWNSTLESLWFNVRIGAWPIYAEQQLNAFELVKELELAVEIRMDYSSDWRVDQKPNFLVKAMEIEEGIKNLMSKDEKMRENVKYMSDKARKALENGGSSYHWLGCFIKDVLSYTA